MFLAILDGLKRQKFVEPIVVAIIFVNFLMGLKQDQERMKLVKQLKKIELERLDKIIQNLDFSFNFDSQLSILVF
jgi:hypothetical protein